MNLYFELGELTLEYLASLEILVSELFWTCVLRFLKSTAVLFPYVKDYPNLDDSNFFKILL